MIAGDVERAAGSLRLATEHRDGALWVRLPHGATLHVREDAGRLRTAIRYGSIPRWTSWLVAAGVIGWQLSQLWRPGHVSDKVFSGAVATVFAAYVLWSELRVARASRLLLETARRAAPVAPP